jgi:hypothetical protein
MTEKEAMSIIIAHGWFKLERGWYHIDAWNYHGWYDSPRYYPTALDVIKNEFQDKL